MWCPCLFWNGKIVNSCWIGLWERVGHVTAGLSCCSFEIIAHFNLLISLLNKLILFPKEKKKWFKPSNRVGPNILIGEINKKKLHIFLFDNFWTWCMFLATEKKKPGSIRWVQSEFDQSFFFLPYWRFPRWIIISLFDSLATVVKTFSGKIYHYLK